MTAVHRHGDSRTCGATTVISGQGTVFVDGQLASVDGDPNSHGGGALVASTNQVFINGKMVVEVGDSAGADSLCPVVGGAHCGPGSASGSPTVFVGS